MPKLNAVDTLREMSTENPSSCCYLCGEDGVAVIPVHRQGKEFAFEFQLEQGAVIRKITAEIVTTA